MKTLLILFLLTTNALATDCVQMCQSQISFMMDTVASATVEAGRLTCIGQCATANAITILARTVAEAKAK